MRKCLAARLGRALVAALLLGAGACRESGANRPPVFPVQGRVLIGGKPADHALVIFVPVDGSETATIRPSGRCDSAGSFRLGTFTADDGAPAGEYRVLVRWSRSPAGPRDEPDMGPDRLNGRGLNLQKPAARVTIRAGENDLEPIRIR